MNTHILQADIYSNGASTGLDPRTKFHGMSHSISVSSTDSVLCADGYRPARQLRIGDTVINRNGCAARVTGIRRVAASAHSKDGFAEIPVGVLGATELTLVGQRQEILISHFLAAAFFGSKDVLAKARFLTEAGLLRESKKASHEAYQLSFDNQQIVAINGVWVASFGLTGAKVLPVLDELQCALIAQTPQIIRSPRRDT